MQHSAKHPVTTQWGMLVWEVVVHGVGLVECAATGGYPSGWVNGMGVEAWGGVNVFLLLLDPCAKTFFDTR